MCGGRREKGEKGEAWIRGQVVPRNSDPIDSPTVTMSQGEGFKPTVVRDSEQFVAVLRVYPLCDILVCQTPKCKDNVGVFIIKLKLNKRFSYLSHYSIYSHSGCQVLTF